MRRAVTPRRGVHRRGACALLLLVPAAALAQAERLTVIFGGRSIGHLTATTDDEQGRRRLRLQEQRPRPDARRNHHAEPRRGCRRPGPSTAPRRSATRSTSSSASPAPAPSGATPPAPARSPATARPSYVPQTASPWSLGLYARLLDKTVSKQHAGAAVRHADVEEGRRPDHERRRGHPCPVTAYTLGGTSTVPDYVLLDARGHLFAVISPSPSSSCATATRKRMPGCARSPRRCPSDRLVAIQKAAAHRYGAPVRIRNVRLFDPNTKSLTDGGLGDRQRQQHRRRRAGRQSRPRPARSPSTAAAARSSPGMFEMHAHLEQDDALLNLLAGITSRARHGQRPTTCSTR